MRQTQQRQTWSYIGGEKGRNRVRAFERGPVIYLDYIDAAGTRVKQSLGHADRARAKQQVDALVAKFGTDDAASTDTRTLAGLFEIYEREVTPTKSIGVQEHDRRTFALFVRAFGGTRRPETLNVRDWDAFIRDRKSGALTHAQRQVAGVGVRAAAIAADLRLLLAVLNWAERARDDAGRYLLDKNPLRGLRIPTEPSPRRPVMTPALFAAVREAAAGLSMAAEMFVCLLWYTGHRGASVRQLRWSDLDLARGTVLWRASADKIGYEHQNPLHSDLIPTLARARAVAELTGDVCLFPDPRSPDRPMTRMQAVKLWQTIAAAAGIPRGSRIGTHSFRRAFANRLRDVNLRDLKDLGGWKTERTVVGTYLQPEEEAQRAALARLSGITQQDQ